jgi:long-chain acyl-CoA synthetase
MKGAVMTCDFTIYDMIARNADLYPEKEMMVYEGNRVAFKTYQKKCDQYAGGLLREGLAAGDRIAVLSGSCDDFLVLLGAAAKIGAVLVPLNIRLNEQEIAFILKDCSPIILVSGREYRDTATKAAAQAGSVQKCFAFKTHDPGGGFFPFSALGREEPGEPALAGSAHSPCMILYTAAVGGTPKGCLLSQSNLLSMGLQLVHLLKISDRDCPVCTLPLFHVGGLSMAMASMLTGGKTVLVERFDPPEVLGLLTRESGTFLMTFPPMLAAILDAQEKIAPDLSSLRAGCGVDNPETIDRFLKMNPRAVFYSLYGQTEAMPVSGCNYADRPGSIGLPALQTRIALIDDLDRPVTAGTPGEICVRSSAVFQGYWNLKAETAYVSRNGWHHTGDLGRIDEQGFLWYAGRKPEKELIKPGGENVYPAEVEKTILEHGAIAEVCVIGVPDAQWGEAVKAVCVLRRGCSVSAAELSDYVASRIARYKKPKHVVFVDELPKLAGGSVDRERVKKTFSG